MAYIKHTQETYIRYQTVHIVNVTLVAVFKH